MACTGFEKGGELRAEERFHGGSHRDGCGLSPLKGAGGGGGELRGCGGKAFLQTVEDLLCVLPLGVGGGGGDEVLQKNEPHLAYGYA